jgi:DNA repair protein RecO (recombination protein O)
MNVENASALVLRLVEFSETSLVVTLFTREFGKVRALAKGARRPKGPFESALDLLAECRIVFYRKSSEALDLLTEARLERRFRPARRDLSCLYAGYYVAELLGELTEDADPHPELYDEARETLHALSEPGVHVGRGVLRFELGALHWLGHFPSLAVCVECGSPVAPQGRMAFGLQAGGVLCARCRPGKKHVASLSAAALRTMQHFADPDNRTWRNVVIDRAVFGEIRGVVNQFLCNLFGKRPRLHSFLGGVAG